MPDFTLDTTPAKDLARGSVIRSRRQTYPRPSSSNAVYFLIGSPRLTMLPERQKQCKVLTFKGSCRSPDDPKCSPTVGSSVPFAVTRLPIAESSEWEGDLLHLSAAGLSKKHFTGFEHSSSCDNPERWAFKNWALRAKEGPLRPPQSHPPSPAGPLRRTRRTGERRSENSRKNDSQRIAGAGELPGA